MMQNFYYIDLKETVLEFAQNKYFEYINFLKVGTSLEYK